MNYNLENSEYGELMKISTIFLIVLRTKKELAPVVVKDNKIKSLKPEISFSN